jgi:hypothetical protein
MPDEKSAIPEALGDSFYTCTVLAAGPAENGTFYIRLTDKANAFVGTWYCALPGFEREMLAAAYTAMSIGCDAVVMLPSTDAYSTIKRFYVSH